MEKATESSDHQEKFTPVSRRGKPGNRMSAARNLAPRKSRIVIDVDAEPEISIIPTPIDRKKSRLEIDAERAALEFRSKELEDDLFSRDLQILELKRKVAQVQLELNNTKQTCADHLNVISNLTRGVKRDRIETEQELAEMQQMVRSYAKIATSYLEQLNGFRVAKGLEPIDPDEMDSSE